MKYLKRFNEKLGISDDMVNQVDGYYKEIMNSDETEFSLLYQCDQGNYFFKLVIDTKCKVAGNFGHESYSDTKKLVPDSFIITIKDRKDKATILHEVKHLDHYLKNNDYISQNYINRNQVNSLVSELIYVYEPTEFQSKYHGYYTEIDDYIKARIKIGENPTRENVINWLNNAIRKSEDQTYTYYNSRQFKLSDYLSKNEMYSFFLLCNDSKGAKNTKINKLLSFFGIVMDKNFDRFISNFDKEMDKRKQNFHKKFNRLYSLFVDKYAK